MFTQAPTFALLGQVARYTETLAKDPQSTVFVPLAEIFRQCGLLQEACAVAEKGLQTLPGYAPGYVVLARIQAQQGQLAPAQDAFEAALALDESNADALKGLARLCSLQGEPVRARSLLEKLLEFHPEDQAARKMLDTLPPPPAPVDLIRPAPAPLAKLAESVPEESKPQRSGRAAPNPNAPISTATIAEIYVRQGFTLRALKVYRDLLQADPHNEEIRRKLVELKAQIDRDQGKEDESTAGFEEESAILPAPEVQTVSATAPALGSVIAAGVIEQLEGWLVAIEQRRGHV